MNLPSTDPAQPLRVIVVDADERTRQSLAGLLGIGRRCVVVASAGQATTALELAAALSPDLVVVDPRLPDIDDGLAFIARLRERFPAVRVLVMSRSGGPEAGSDLPGADAVVRKTFRAHDLLDACLAACAPRLD